MGRHNQSFTDSFDPLNCTCNLEMLYEKIYDVNILGGLELSPGQDTVK